MAVDDSGAPPSPAAAALLAEVPKLVRAVSRQLKEKAVKTRTAAFHCLRMLAGSLPGCLAEHAPALVPGVTRALKETTANPLRLEALAFLQLALATHPPAVWQPHCAALVPAVLSLVDDRYYKITAESLRVIAELVRVLRPAPPEAGFKFAPHVPPIFKVVRARLDAQDQDQEVKECAIETMGLTICHLGDACADALPGTLPVLLDRLRNEITRVTAVKTFALLAAAKLDTKLSSPLNGSTVLQAVVTELASFLRKSNKPLRQASLVALDVIVTHHSALLQPADYDEVLSQLPPLLSDADLHVAHLALVLAATVVHHAAALTVPRLGEAVIPRAMELLTSPLLQGYALKSALDFFAALVAHDAPALDFGTVSSKLLQLAGTGAATRSRHTLGVLSQAVAVCATVVPQPAKRAAMVDSFIKQLSQPNGQVMALLCLGEIGQRNDLSARAPLLDAIVAVFDSNSEEFKAAAAYALGNVAAGNLPFYLPQLLKHIEAGKHEYLMLAALKELAVSGAVALAGFAEQMLPCLFAFAERDEEGVRNVAAECVGRLAAAAPGAVLPALESRLGHPSAHVRAVLVNSLRFTLNEPGVHLPAPLVGRFLGALKDQDLKVSVLVWGGEGVALGAVPGYA
jgi:cullin-associated NEDD8-dissociated protein 1